MKKVFLPGDIGELWTTWQECPQAALMAGGTDLLVGLRAGQIDTTAIIGLERIDELQQIDLQEREIIIGSMVTHQQLLENDIIHNYLPILEQAISVLGSPGIRHMATIGGNICTGSPAGDTLPPLYVLQTRLELLSPSGSRTVPIEEFIHGPGQIDLGPMELLYRIIIPIPGSGSRGWYYKVGQRRALAISITNMAALLQLDLNNTILKGRIAWGSVGPTIMSFPEIDKKLEGQQLSEALLRAIGTEAALRVMPITDLRSSAEYRRMLVANLPLRLLK